MKIAIVVSKFNEEVTGRLLEGAVTRLYESGIVDEDIAITQVPGAVEIPLIAQTYAQIGDYDAVICLGAVIQGETNHYDYVCQQVSYGCQRVALDFQIPVIFGVLTTEDQTQALARAGGSEGNRGSEAADTALEMIKVKNMLGAV